MRHAIILLVIAALLTVGGTYLSQHGGKVVIELQNGLPYIGLNAGFYEMSLWYFLLALAVVILLFMLVVKILWSAIKLPKVVSNVGKNKRTVVANKMLQKGMLAMGKGQWKKAEKMLIKGARLANKAGSDPSLFLSTAAQAAQQQGDNARRDEYLLEARQLSVEGIDTLSSSLAEARLHLEAGESRQALECIKEQRVLHAHNPQLMLIQSQANEQLGYHAAVWDLLSRLKKQFPDKDRYVARQLEVAKNVFTSETVSLDDIERVWSELPKVAKSDDSMFLNYISGLIRHGKEEMAEQLLSKSIKKHHSDSVIHAYTQLDVGSSTERLGKVKRWLRVDPDNAYLNYGAAKLAFQSELLEEAKEYAAKALKKEPLPEAFALLGKICEALGDKENALQAYKSSVGLTYAHQLEAVAGDVLPVSDVAALPAAQSTEAVAQSTDTEATAKSAEAEKEKE